MANNSRKEKTKAQRIRISIINDESHQELSSFKTTRNQMIVIAVSAAVIIIAGTYLLTSRTFIKHTIPGYPSSETKRLAVENTLLIDSLERVIETWSMQIANIQRVATGKDPLAMDSISINKAAFTVDEASMAEYSKNDSILREQVKQEEQFSVSTTRAEITQIEGLHFYTPVKGVVTEGYNKGINHPYIDIAAPASSSVCAVLDGTVISSVWNDETGYVIQIQHDNDLISVYKHNEKNLKKTGDKVTAGTPVALVGSTGSLSTGAHLHFELWHKGEAIDPALYITF